MNDSGFTSDLAVLAKDLPDWVQSPGAKHDFILTSRVRLARNLEDTPFPGEALPEQRRQVLNRVTRIAPQSQSLNQALALDLSGSPAEDLQFLAERRLISGDIAGRGGQGVLVGPGESVSIMVNEEDHLRIQAVLPGLRLGEALDAAAAVDSEIEGYLGFAYSGDWGYLTSCPTNVGTGLRASVLMHLPGLVLTRRISKLMQGVTAMNMAVRGFHGEGSEVMGNFIQISNQTTLGVDEHEIVNHLNALVSTLVAEEEKAVAFMVKTAKVVLEDKIYRAWGILSNARSIGMEEVLSLTSAVRLGIRMELPGLCSAETLNEFLVSTQPEHLVRAEGKELSREERRIRRANLIRSRLEAGEREQTGPRRGMSNGDGRSHDR